MNAFLFIIYIKNTDDFAANQLYNQPMNQLTLIQQIIVWAPPSLFAITLHEVAHGWVASKLGDKTALLLGRLSINPIKHIDLFGTIIIPLSLLLMGGFVFGWARPVPINPENFKHPRRDVVLVALAGCTANFLMAIGWALILKLGIFLKAYHLAAALPIAYMGEAGIAINIMLGVVNLIPIPPLDGSRIFMPFLPGKWLFFFYRLSPFFMLLLLALIATGLLNYIISPVINFLCHALLHIFIG